MISKKMKLLSNIGEEILFFRCVNCKKFPATKKCFSCFPKNPQKICHLCDNKIHSKIENFHHIEMIPFQGFSKYNSILSILKIFLNHNPIIHSIQI